MRKRNNEKKPNKKKRTESKNIIRNTDAPGVNGTNLSLFKKSLLLRQICFIASFRIMRSEMNASGCYATSENRICSRNCQNRKNLAMITDGFALLQKEPKNIILSSILGV